MAPLSSCSSQPLIGSPSRSKWPALHANAQTGAPAALQEAIVFGRLTAVQSVAQFPQAVGWSYFPVAAFRKPSSTWLSQSSSRPLQTSTPGGPAVALQTVAAPAASHTRSPNRWHVPTPTWHGSPRSGQDSSMFPSQSSSRPLQVSALVGPAGDEHTVAPVGFATSQTRTPGRVQAPTPEKQVVPRSLHDAPSSTTPSQSSSKPLQTSTPASPGAALQIVGPAAFSGSQTRRPARAQAPLPARQGAPRSPHAAPSSMAPSQSSSLPLQVSTWGTQPASAIPPAAPPEPPADPPELPPADPPALPPAEPPAPPAPPPLLH